MKLRGLIPNFYTHVSVSNLYMPRITTACLFGCSKIGRPIMGIYKFLTDKCFWKFDKTL